ncbi:MAG: serine/threonine-protein kinase [Actinomycetota bacterium]
MTTLTATGQVLADRYRLNRWLGGGSMAEVWEATDVRMDLTVAVKVLRATHINDPVAIERFRIEARLGANLDHHGIAKVHDVNVDGRNSEPPWMVQEFFPGVPLSELLDQKGALHPSRAAAIVSQAAEAAHAAHRVGIVHRDLTPRNLLVGTDDVVKVTDFGIARADDRARLTMAGQVVGTPAYLSPEQVRGRTASSASDVYTLAVVLYECLAGVRPFDGGNAIEVARAHVDQTPPPLPTSVPGPLRAVVAVGLAKEPENRPTAKVFATRIKEAVSEVVPRSQRATDQDTRTHQRPEHTTRVHRQRAVDVHRVHRGREPLPLLPDATPWLTQVREWTAAAAGRAPGLNRRVHETVRKEWEAARPELVRRARAAWRGARLMRTGWVGVVIVMIAALAVLSSG